MSLSFVSSAVLSSSDGVSHNEEKPIESSETRSLRSSGAGASRPLFDQLRANREADEEKRDEAAKALRGTRTLDEEDCAHLDAVERVRLEREAQRRNEVEDEVAAFRAARADRNAAASAVEAGDRVSSAGDEDGIDTRALAAAGDSHRAASSSRITSIAPKIVVKKRRRRQANQQEKDSMGSASNSGSKRVKGDTREESKDSFCNERVKPPDVDLASLAERKETVQSEGTKNEVSKEENSGGLGGLLGGYGSDSD